jgi:hypothetical protein
MEDVFLEQIDVDNSSSEFNWGVLLPDVQDLHFIHFSLDLKLSILPLNQLPSGTFVAVDHTLSMLSSVFIEHLVVEVGRFLCLISAITVIPNKVFIIDELEIEMALHCLWVE